MDRLAALEAQVSALAQITSESFGRLEAAHVAFLGLIPYFGAMQGLRELITGSLDAAREQHRAVLLNTDAEHGFDAAAAELRALLLSLDALPQCPTNGSSGS